MSANYPPGFTQGEHDRLFAVPDYTPDTHAERCVKCNRELVCDLDTNTWTYGDDFDYYPISKPEDTRLGIYCRNCWENEGEDVVLAQMGVTA